MKSVTKLNLENSKLKNIDFDVRMLKAMLENQIEFYMKETDIRTAKIDKLTTEINLMTNKTFELQRENEMNERKARMNEANRKLLIEQKREMKETAEKLSALNKENLENNQMINATWNKYKYSRNIIKKAKSLVENFIEITKSSSFDDGNFLTNLLETLLSAKKMPGADK